MKVVITGVKVIETKSKRKGYNYFFQKPFSAYENENSECSGMATGFEFSYTDFGVKPLDEVEIFYEPGYEGKAIVSDMVIIKQHIPSSENKPDVKTAK